MRIKISANPVIKRWQSEYLYGILHCKDRSAKEYANGDKAWYCLGNPHRVDGPAIERGNKEWRVEGKLHRLDGPAIIAKNGLNFWYREGILYRIDGPTQQELDRMKQSHSDNPKIEYWINGEPEAKHTQNSEKLTQGAVE